MHYSAVGATQGLGINKFNRQLCRLPAVQKSFFSPLIGRFHALEQMRQFVCGSWNSYQRKILLEVATHPEEPSPGVKRSMYRNLPWHSSITRHIPWLAGLQRFLSCSHARGDSLWLTMLFPLGWPLMCSFCCLFCACVVSPAEGSTAAQSYHQKLG